MAHKLRPSIGSNGCRKPVIPLDVVVEGSGGIFSGYLVYSYIVDLFTQPIGDYEDVYILVTPEIPAYGEVNHEVQGDIRLASVGD